ncbi:MAG: hypothetical protein B6I31_01490 [Desulfobacteraceae bacterium 4572_19]|nr:MAG: hypothetical protein B6I31_01490 [Desulfobacteraceae bacterium 4572_19]
MMIQPWMYNQLLKVKRYRPELVDQMLDAILTQQAELRWLVIVGAYIDEEINLGKVAELLGIHRLELQEQFVRQGITLRLGIDTPEEAQAEVVAITQWNETANQAVQHK